jgi:hypothetical protein
VQAAPASLDAGRQPAGRDPEVLLALDALRGEPAAAPPLLVRSPDEVASGSSASLSLGDGSPASLGERR